MMKNRAGWLALSVLAIATALMVFFVLPQISGDKKPIGEAVNEAGQEVKEAVDKAAADAATKAATDHVAKLTSSADEALTELKALFADGKVPTAEAFVAARTKLEAATKQLAELKLPEGSDTGVADAYTKAQAAATAAADMLKSLPADPAAAIATLSGNNPPSANAPETTGEPAASHAAAGPFMPTFDVLRVERDGSTVIAGGNAEPGAHLEVVNREKVIAKTEIGPSGDFAAVLDMPLPAGDHELVLRVIGKDGKSTLSNEVATISVPRNADGQLLAMVSKPGTASRIINAPTVQAAAGEANQQVADNGAATTAPAEPDTSGSTAAAPAADAAEQGKPATAAAKPEVHVSAVEIEDDKIFVAGLATPGSTVKAYADDKLIGTATTAADGSFVVDGSMPLSVGDHTIRVDMHDAAGAVSVRASVPFNRPEGDQVAVVASSTPTGSQPALTPLEDGAFDKLRNEAAQAFAILDGLYADGKIPSDEQLAAARSATKIALKSLTAFQLSSDAEARMKEMVERTGKSAALALEALDALPGDAKSVGAGLAKLRAMIDDTVQPALDSRKEAAPAIAAANEAPAPSGQAQSATAATAATAPAAADTTDTATATTEPKLIEQAPLTESTNSVIIRRGDTLWQISRRIYGKGVRYTTIYLANKDHIDNPDMIQPGQIFGVPKDARPDSEVIHRKRLSGEAVE